VPIGTRRNNESRQTLLPLLFGAPLVPGRFIRRYKRFFADVRLEDGSVVVAHCANSGSMKSCLVPDGRVWLSVHDEPKRKLKYTWEVAEVGAAKVFVHPARANHLVREAIETGVLTELLGYETLTAEPRINPQTRFDFLLARDDDRCYVEVKNVTLWLGDGRTSFPDAVSTRASKHLRELVEMKRRGHRSTLVFCASRTDASSVVPADDIDPQYGKTLRFAMAEGVTVLAYRVDIEPEGPRPSITLTHKLPIYVDHAPSAESASPAKKRHSARAK
jgi:sugar fermentation stimulation protein A